MRCPTCGRPTRLVSTDELQGGATRNVRLCTIPTTLAHPGVVFETVELLAAVVSGMGPAMLEREMVRAKRGLVRRAVSEQLRQRIIDRLAAGARPLHIAQELGVSETRVRQVRDEAGMPVRKYRPTPGRFKREPITSASS